MCGIAGILHFDPARLVDPNHLEAMGDGLRHRGPDAGAIWTDGPLGLVHRRLKIIDLSESANQPMLSREGQVALVYNGECYNYLELRRELIARGHVFTTDSDTEVVLQAYLEYGENFLERLRGMFALALWDRRSRRLLLARDRLGIKPLYYSKQGGCLAFASEVQPLLRLPWISRRMDPEALGLYFRTYTVQDPHSIMADIQRVEPGGILTINTSGLHARRWWQLSAELRAPDMEQSAKDLTRLLEETVSQHLAADVPVGVALSGGVDSSLVAVLAARRPGLHSFSLVQPGSLHDEGPEAAAFAAAIGTMHHEVQLPPLTPALFERFVRSADEPFAISSGLGLYALAQAAAQNGVKVLLTGDGGDELFAGYPWRHAAALDGKGQDPDPARAYAALSCYNGPNTLGALLAPEFLAAAGTGWQEVLAKQYRECPVPDPLARRLYTDLRSTLTGEMLAKTDRMTMAHGVEGRVPLLDHRVVEYAMSLPAALKISGGQGKAVLRHVAEGLLPHTILSRPKRGFNICIADSLASQQKDWTISVLERAEARDFCYAPGAVRRLFIAPLQANQPFALENSHRLFAVLALELWMSIFMDA